MDIASIIASCCLVRVHARHNDCNTTACHVARGTHPTWYLVLPDALAGCPFSCLPAGDSSVFDNSLCIAKPAERSAMREMHVAASRETSPGVGCPREGGRAGRGCRPLTPLRRHPVNYAQARVPEGVRERENTNQMFCDEDAYCRRASRESMGVCRHSGRQKQRGSANSTVWVGGGW